MTSPIPPSKEEIEAAMRIVAESRGIHDPQPEQMVSIGLIQTDRIIRTAAGFYFGGVLVPFDEAFRTLALHAVDSLRSRLEVAERNGAIARAVVADAEYALACEGGSFGYDAMQQLRRSVREFNRDMESTASTSTDIEVGRDG